MASPHADPSANAVSAALSDHAGALRAFMGARVPSSEVDDLLQVAALRAVERAGSLEDRERALAWLYRVHRNVIADALRKRERQTRLMDAAASLSEEPVTFAEATCGCSLAQVTAMNARYAEILELVDLRDLTLPEAAAVLGVTTNNATVRLHRARKALRSRMREHCGVENPRDCASCRCVDDGCCAA